MRRYTNLMEFKSDASIDGKLTYGYEEGWHWSKNKGGYHQGRDFFWMHWEVGERAPKKIKLHIESPNAATDSVLNQIKREVVAEILLSRFKDIAEKNGFVCKVGSRVKPEHMEKFKGTSPFHVVLTDEQSQKDHQANIKLVNGVLGEVGREVVERFSIQLKRHFDE